MAVYEYFKWFYLLIVHFDDSILVYVNPGLAAKNIYHVSKYNGPMISSVVLRVVV